MSIARSECLRGWSGLLVVQLTGVVLPARVLLLPGLLRDLSGLRGGVIAIALAWRVERRFVDIALSRVALGPPPDIVLGEGWDLRWISRVQSCCSDTVRNQAHTLLGAWTPDS